MDRAGPSSVSRSHRPSTTAFSAATTTATIAMRFRLFQDAGRGGIRGGTNRWIDSICYYTMVGECYYQMGQHQQALVQYTSALQLYYAFNNWMVRVQFPVGIRPANPSQFRPVAWGCSSAGRHAGQLSRHVPDHAGAALQRPTGADAGGRRRPEPDSLSDQRARDRPLHVARHAAGGAS